jgi:hypothetical protein
MACKANWKSPLMSRTVISFSLTTTLIAVAATASAEGQASRLTRLKYNHPGLIVDLGVGLWAQPLSVQRILSG